PAPIRRLVLNDVGPTIDAGALQRIGLYLGNVGRFASLQEAADARWAISQSFGPHTSDEWLALSRPMIAPASRRTADGKAKRPG
ncbi:alpha/beta hydrolase, partial [Stenotrophomonas maltophilia]